jgi:SAM-dependent methyltransferase
MTTDPSAGPVNSRSYQDVLRTKLLHRSIVSGSITIPAAPGMIDEYVDLCSDIFEDIGRPFSEQDIANLRGVLVGQLAEAFEASQRSQIVITYEAPIGGVVSYHVKAEWFTIEGAYDNWVATREPPFFGTHPDARVMALADETLRPATLSVLDIGAGTGRNALALARRGHPVDAVEIAPKFADMIRAESTKESLDVRVIQRDVFASLAEVRRDYGLIVLSEVVSDFRSQQQLRQMFELAAACLTGGGRIVFNAFLACRGYVPDEGARALGQQCYTTVFTAEEVDFAVSGLPLRLLTNDSVYDYEKANLPDGAWPPTSWYADWVSGLDVFPVPRDQSPIEMRWLVYQKQS